MNAEPRSDVGRRGGPGGSRPDSGNALVVSLLILMVLTSAGVAYVAVTKSEKQISGNAVAAAEALYTAEAGISEGLYRMSFPADSVNYIGGGGLPAPGWGRYVVLANGASLQDPGAPALATDGLDNNGNAFVDESGERYPEVLTKQTINASALRYPYVRIEYKTQGGQLVRFGDADKNALTPPVENMVDGAPVLRITASGRRGTASKILEAEAVRFPIISVGSALWVGNHTKFNGNAFLIDGNDHYPNAPYDTIPGAKAVPGILHEGPVSDLDMNPTQGDNILGEGGTLSVEPSPFTYDFNALWTQLSALANNSYTGDQAWSGAMAGFGTAVDPKVTVVNGNCKMSGTWAGHGIIMVNGNLEMTGGSTFHGIVIVTGDIDLAGGGPADVARCVGTILYQGALVGDSTYGGAARIWYSSAAINKALSVGRYTLSWWRER